MPWHGRNRPTRQLAKGNFYCTLHFVRESTQPGPKDHPDFRRQLRFSFDCRNNGIDMINTENVELANVTINSAGDDALFIVDTADTYTINNSTINGAVSDAISILHNVTGFSGSGNTITGTIGGVACNNGGTVSGSITYNGSSTCP